MTRKKAWWIGILIVLALATLVIAESNIVKISRTSIAVNSWIHKSNGIQDADRTTMIVQKTLIKKNAAKIKQENPGIDPEQAPAMLSAIDGKKMAHYKTINGALLLQKEIYDSLADNGCTQSKLDQFKQESENAKCSLKELKSLTEEQVRIYKGTTKDEQAVKVAWSTYYTWESAVGGLSSDPLEDARFAELDNKINQESASGIAAAEEQAKAVTCSDIDPQDKSILEKEILVDGRNVLGGLQQIMNQMQGALQKVMHQLQGAVGGSKPLMNPLGVLTAMASGKPPIDMSVITDLQKTFEAIGSQLQAFSGSFGSFMQVAGSLVGVQIPLTPLQMPTFKP